MRKIIYILPKREKFLYILMFLLPLSFMYLFSFDMRFNLNWYGTLYKYRYVIYIFCFITCFWKYLIIHLIFHNLLFVIKFDENKFNFSSSLPFRRISGNVPYNSITKIIVTIRELKVFFIKENKERNLKSNKDNNENSEIIENNNINNKKDINEVNINIPIILGGFMHKDDYLYIINLFKDIEIEYDNTMQEKVLETISNQYLFKHHKICAYIACILLIFVLVSNLFFIFIYSL